ncbi:hypothetical protein CHS0354_012348 [Potamilus streckersoni]|uniref:RNA methyltransferase n=1 Tax=Potamilus streckersoni TaxID=2493646 RepID=A0AAE0SKW0_9BIVA|nr:hypothetical protein CHS0354_012348 [Potamilus streckersoni]
MSVEVKTPTKTRFEHAEFQCGEKNLASTSGERQERLSTLTVSDTARFSIPAQGASGQYQKKRRHSQIVRSEQSVPHGSRRKRLKSSFVLPTKFLLGGNIEDPLNLNSLYHDEQGKILNAETPRSSPLPTPSHKQIVEVFFPSNISDPLNLNSSDLESVSKCKRKKRHSKARKRDDSLLEGENKDLMEALKIEIEPDDSATCSSAPETSKADTSKAKVCDKIVSPVLPQTSPKSKNRRRTMSCSGRPEASSLVTRSLLITSDSPPPENVKADSKKSTPPKNIRRQSSQPPKSQTASQKEKPSTKFIYGNYNRYYGYRNQDHENDKRLQSLKLEWFEGKDVLDIGCNVGHLTLAVAKSFHPRKIIGIDIDPHLISVARKNIRHYISSSKIDTPKFPVSSSLNFGPIAAPPVDRSIATFPHNVMFMQGNYVLESDSLLEFQKEKYDTILALSLTKWIHLNWGDSGLKRVFKRIYRQLRPGGQLVLEPQSWSSYKKKKKLTEAIHKNFQSIQLKPDQFKEYLLSKEVGFTSCELKDVPFNVSKGFRRPIMLFTKAETSQNSPKYEETSLSPQTSHITKPATRGISINKSPEIMPEAPSLKEASSIMSSEPLSEAANPILNVSSKQDGNI